MKNKTFDEYKKTSNKSREMVPIEYLELILRRLLEGERVYNNASTVIPAFVAITIDLIIKLLKLEGFNYNHLKREIFKI